MWLVQMFCFSFPLCWSWNIFICYSYHSEDRDILLSGSTCISCSLEKHLSIRVIFTHWQRAIIWPILRDIFRKLKGMFLLLVWMFKCEEIWLYSQINEVSDAGVLLPTSWYRKGIQGEKFPNTEWEEAQTASIDNLAEISPQESIWLFKQTSPVEEREAWKQHGH